ncbi:MAG: DNA adenine methylase [Candidatus Marsarchaeota archaeon]|jgi:DNA adenine methylase|nr:DNA adenine methylase [Candidatus Marsarchaeota archaeon]
MPHTTTNFKGILRYPGGKSRAVKRILPLVPEYEEYREPMVGGGALFFALRQQQPKKKYWINDINTDLYLLWKFCKEKPDELIYEIKKLKNRYKEGKLLYKYLKNDRKLKIFQRAVRFFILNRITFYGLVDSGGYSDEAFHKRFTESSIQNIRVASKLLQGVKITNTDYSKMLKNSGNGVFIFLDPPYLTKRNAKLYGKNGELHIKFDHERFARDMMECKARWLVTYDDCSGINNLFDFADKKRWVLQYGTNNKKGKRAKKGRELFISNYTTPQRTLFNS